MPNETNATTRLAMMRAIQKLRQANVARVKGAPGVGYSTEQMAEIVERESGYRELYEAAALVEKWWLEDEIQNHVGAPAWIFALRAALAKARGESQGETTNAR